MDRAEIKKYLKSKGFGSTSIEYILDAISEREAIENARNSEEVKRNKDIMEFKPNPWKADKEFTDLPDDKFPGKDRIKRALAYAENDRNNTKVQIPEPVGKWLESRGIDVDTLLRLEPLLRKYDSLTDEQKMRFEELKDFEPNPGKATLNRIGDTKYVVGDHGLPIYQEDVDMIKKSQPLAKKLVELQKKNQEQEPVEEKPLSEMTTQEKIDYWYAKEEEEEKKQTLRTLKDIIDEVRNVKPEELNVGPDTTENIHEISESVDETADEEDPNKIHPIDIIRNWTPEEKTKRLVKEFEKYYKAPAECNKQEESVRDSGDVMFGVDLETQGLQKEFNPRDIVLGPNPTITPGKDIDDEPYPTTEEMKKYIDEQCNKNVSDHGKDYSYSSILRQMDDTHTRKNNDYGDAAYQGYKKYGPAYFLVQLHNKLTRLESLTINNRSQMVKDESIDDTLLDLANYAVMYLESRHRDD